MAADQAKQEPKGEGEAKQAPSFSHRRYCEKRRSSLLLVRSHELTDWMAVSDYVDPSRGIFAGDGANNGGNTRRRRRSRSRIINGRATQCLRVAAAGMTRHMTSKSEPWFEMSTPNQFLRKVPRVKLWLQMVTEIIRDTLERSNFYKAMPVCYTEDLMFGVAAMLIVEDPDEVVRFHPLTAGTFAVGLNDAGKVDTLWRCYTKTARQLEERYGEDNLPRQVREALKNAPDTEFTIESLIEPNPNVRPGIGPLGVQAPQFRPWRETVWILGTEAEKHGILDIGGHYEAPFVAFRFNPVGDQVYSTSPCLDALGDIKQLQFLENRKSLLVDLLANPPKSIPETMRNLGGLSFMPGANNYVPVTQNQITIGATYTPQPVAVQYAGAEIRETEGRIEEAMFYRLFLMLESLGDQAGRTATEIIERREEKVTVLGPTLEAITDEGLDPTVIRVFRMLERVGRIPPPPEELLNEPIKIEYTSILAKVARAASVASIERVAGFVATAGKVFPGMLDRINDGEMLAEYADRVGAPASMMNGEEQVAALQQAKQQQQRMAMLAQLADPLKKGADAMATMNGTKPDPDSLGAGLAQQLQGALTGA